MNSVNHTEKDRLKAWQRFPRPLIQKDHDGRSYFQIGTSRLWELLNQVGQYFGQTNPFATPGALVEYLAENSSEQLQNDQWGIKYIVQTAVDEAIHGINPPDPESKLTGSVPVSLLFQLYEILTKQTLPIDHPIREENVTPDFSQTELLTHVLDELRIVKGMLEQIDITTRVNGHRIMMFS